MKTSQHLQTSGGVITTNMRTVILLMLTAIAVTGLRRHAPEEILLKEIMESVEGMLKSPKMNLNQFVKDVFPQAGCSKKHLCQAAMVMMNTNLNVSKLHRQLLRRQLLAYVNNSGHHNCSVQASEEHKMNVFLTRIKECSQEQYFKLLKNKKH